MKRENVWPWVLVVAIIALFAWLNERERAHAEHLKTTDPAAYRKFKEEALDDVRAFSDRPSYP